MPTPDRLKPELRTLNTFSCMVRGGSVQRLLVVRFASILALLGFLHFAGGHWVVLQGVAWTGMFFGSLQTASVTESLQRTFDPERPCGLCVKIQEGRQQERERAPAVVSTAVKLEFCPSVNGTLPVPSESGRHRYAVSDAFDPGSWLGDPPQAIPRRLA